MTETGTLTDTQLDAALDLLRPPAPSAGLEDRVDAFAPLPFRAPAFRQRRLRMAIAASLLLAAGAGALLHIAFTETTPMTAATAGPPASRMATAVSPADAPAGTALPDEIRPPEIALVDVPAGRPAVEPISIADLPLN